MTFLKTLTIGGHELRVLYDYYPGSPASRYTPEEPEEFGISSVSLRIAPGNDPKAFLDISTLLDEFDDELEVLQKALQEAHEQERYESLRARYYGDE